jgi:hypothetical protein
MDSVGISELETYEEADGLYTEEPAIHIVTWCKCQSVFTCFLVFNIFGARVTYPRRDNSCPDSSLRS